MSSRPLRPLLPADSTRRARDLSSSSSSSLTTTTTTTTTPPHPAGDSSRQSNNSGGSGSSSGGNSTAPPSARRPPRRHSVLVACEGCRQRKVRCDGARPACGPCRRCRQRRRRGAGADAPAGATAALCVYADDGGGAPRTYGGLQAENAQLRGLYALLRDLPDADARDLFHRIRARHDPLILCRAVHDARLLLPPPPGPAPASPTEPSPPAPPPP